MDHQDSALNGDNSTAIADCSQQATSTTLTHFFLKVCKAIEFGMLVSKGVC